MIKHRFCFAATAMLLACAMSGTAWAARGGTHGSSGNGGTSHGATVSATAHSAKMNGQPVGPAVRDVARSNSQGPSHASANAISHVQNSPGRANSNSVLGTGTSTSATGTGATSHGHAHAKAKPKGSKSGKKTTTTQQ